MSLSILSGVGIGTGVAFACVIANFRINKESKDRELCLIQSLTTGIFLGCVAAGVSKFPFVEGKVDSRTFKEVIVIGTLIGSLNSKFSEGIKDSMPEIIQEIFKLI